MPNRAWNEDEEANEWLKTHRNHVKRGKWKTINVQFESRRGFLTLNRDEWFKLQEFLETHTIANSKFADYEHLPSKVRALILDWMNSQA